MKKTTYKYTVECVISVIAKSAVEARELVQEQLAVVNREGDPYGMNSSKVEIFSKYNKFGRARRVKFYEGGRNEDKK